jgi:hypothetical protein
MTIRLAPEIFQALAGGAEDRSLSPPALAAEILTKWVLSSGLLMQDDKDRLEAQRALLEWVEGLVENHRKADDWDEHITRHIFETIKLQRSELYARAIKGGRKTQLNREIGALVRRGLGAFVWDVDGRLYGQLPRGADSLIKTYTYLFRRPQK